MPAISMGAFLSISKTLRRYLLPVPLVVAIGVVLAGGLSARPAAAATTVSVIWNSNVEPDVTGYVVSWGTASGAHTNTIDVANKTSLQFTEPDPTVTYYFSVQAYNSSGLLSGYSAEVASVPTVVVSAAGGRDECGHRDHRDRRDLDRHRQSERGGDNRRFRLWADRRATAARRCR